MLIRFFFASKKKYLSFVYMTYDTRLSSYLSEWPCPDVRPLSSDIFSINWLLLGLIPGAAAGRGQTEGLEIWLRIKMVNIIQHTHQLYNATNMIDTDLNKWFSGDGEPLYRWRMMMQKQENKIKSAVTTIICAVTSLQRISQVTDDRWCIVSIWAGSDLSTLSTERNGLEQIYQVALLSPLSGRPRPFDPHPCHDDHNQELWVTTNKLRGV